MATARTRGFPRRAAAAPHLAGARAEHMKQKSKRKTELIGLPATASNDFTFEAFSELILQQPLDKIENVLAFASPCDGFRDSLIRVLWHFYCNNGPRVWNSRALLKNRRSLQPS
jgi:hypothetical protein